MLSGMFAVSGGDTGPEEGELMIRHRTASDGTLNVDPNLDILEGDVVRIMRWVYGEADEFAVHGWAFEYKDGVRRDTRLEVWEGFRDCDR